MSDEQPEDVADDLPPEEWPYWAAGVLEAMRVVPSLARAAKGAGIARSTIQRMQNRDVRFAAAMEEARQQALDDLEELVLLRGRQGQPVTKTVTRTYPDGKVETTVTEERHVSDNLAMFYLKRWRPEYRDSYRIEHSGADGGAIKIEMEEKLSEAVGRFDAEVVRLADVRAAREVADGSGS